VRRGQLTFEDLGTPLAEAEMVVLDLETTGTDPARDTITEIGAVKVCGGEVLGEFRTFVDPKRPIPAYIASLTGITDATVSGAPDIEAVLPTFLDFAHDAVLVAHNARFDIGFLRAEAARIAVPWPGNTVVDTLKLARSVYGKDEVRDHRLGTLAAHVGTSVRPDHRALSDARATVDLLHAMIERLDARGVRTVEDLTSQHRKVTPAQQRARHLADTVPSAPGVYQFLDEHGAVLYVGTSRNLRSRVRTYFTAAEKRRKVLDILPRLREIRCIVCRTPLEAQVRELRTIAAEQPPANRHGLRPEKAHWLRLGTGTEGLRGARIAREETGGSAHIGPLASHHDLGALRALLADAALGRRSALENTGAHEGGRIESSPHRSIRSMMLEDPSPLAEHVAGRLRVLSDAGRYEDAARLRGIAETFLAAARRARDLRALASCPVLVAARPLREGRQGTALTGTWEIVAIRSGRFAGSAIAPPRADPRPVARALLLTSQGEADRGAPLCQGYHQEAELLLRWLEGEGMRVVLTEGTWSVPATARFDTAVLTEAYGRTTPAAGD
jgi:DNA polymerase-3 subunit epsilon